MYTQQTFALMKTSWRRLSSSSSEHVFKMSAIRLDQDEYVRLSLTSTGDVFKTSSRDVFKTSWSRPIYLSWPYVLKKSSRRLQNVFETSSRHRQGVFKTSSRRLQHVFKTSSRLPAKIPSRRFQDVPSSNLFYLTRPREVFNTFLSTEEFV